jgi:hypothetical protein
MTDQTMNEIDTFFDDLFTLEMPRVVDIDLFAPLNVDDDLFVLEAPRIIDIAIPQLDIDDALWWDRYSDPPLYIKTGTEAEDYAEFLAREWGPEPAID